MHQQRELGADADNRQVRLQRHYVTQKDVTLTYLPYSHRGYAQKRDFFVARWILFLIPSSSAIS